MKKIIVIAGDKSGDLYGGLLCKKLKEQYLNAELYSFGGPNLAKHSIQIVDLLSHSVSGIIEVLFSLKDIAEVFNRALREITHTNPDLIILIDFPDFNLRLAKILNNKYHIFYYISPQVWAWRKNRIENIKRYVNRMIVIFKFEEEFYKKEKMEVAYFGHPLLEIIEKKDIETKKIISFMPGSRRNEIKAHLPIMLKAKEIIAKSLPDYTFRIIRPDNIPIDFYQSMSAGLEIVDHTYEAIQESSFIITSSGTATVEISILEVPFLVIYKLNLLSWHLLRTLVKTRFIAMTNILASEKIVEELLQDKANPQNIAEVALRYLQNDVEYLALKNELKKIKEILSPYGALDKLTQSIGKYLRLTSLEDTLPKDDQEE
ncbi:MAG: lipid-A-disaccharide synthase [Candidatus Omnitrophota bacterium]|jgi:lipid-A-disaccharide synthase